ncbi:uncharacterized protein LOC144436193 isoform X2 [Glandiceps talaboti]
MKVLWTLIVLLLCDIVGAHIRLVYPPARHYEFDFLDDVNTLEPCGMRSGDEGPITTFATGQMINIKWVQAMAYFHTGGYKIELLEENGDVTTLTDSDDDNYVLIENSAQEYFEITLPESITCNKCTIRIIRQALEWNDNVGKNFWSCADISIQGNAACDCSDHGTCSNDVCTCNDLYHGNDCQYQDECTDDTDCGTDGKCLQIKASAYFRKQCFCAQGYHGNKCTLVNPTDFTVVVDHDEETYYHRHLSDSVVMYWKILKDSSEIEIALEVHGSSWAAVGWKPEGVSGDCTDFPIDRDGYPDRDADDHRKRKRDERVLYSMECSDMVIGLAVQDNYHRIGDYYSRDLSTPNLDEWFGGNYSLTAAAATQNDGITVIKFRKPLYATEKQDYNIENGLMKIIWARGQEIGEYHPGPADYEVNKEFYKPDEFKWHGKDEEQRGHITLNLHENPDDSRTGNCKGEWKSPSTCEGISCDYRVTWSYDDKNDDVTFEIMTSNAVDKWTGIGFSKDVSMPYTDAVIGWVESGGNSPEISDRWIDAARSDGAVQDENDDIRYKAGSMIDGMMTMSFTRNLKTGNTQDVDFDGDECVYFFYVVSGGTFDAVTKEISSHFATPTVSAQPICIDVCDVSDATLSTPKCVTYLLVIIMITLGGNMFWLH